MAFAEGKATARSSAAAPAPPCARPPTSPRHRCRTDPRVRMVTSSTHHAMEGRHPLASVRGRLHRRAEVGFDLDLGLAEVVEEMREALALVGHDDARVEFEDVAHG